MAPGVKLYQHFIEEVSKMGKIKRAWFTTFNLDISFFEKYVLSALMGVSYQDLKSPYKYEQLNDNLANELESLDEDKMEVKIFYDYRALITSGNLKQTSVHLHPIDIKQLTGLNPDLKFGDGVFHPKVILVESVIGEYWLMVSSANLTFGGWSKNRECFFCEKILNTQTGRDIGQFFSGITNSIRGFEENPMLTKLNTGKFGQEESKWYFFSSFNNESFLNQLNNTDEKVPLRVWSPYFSNNIETIVDELQEDYFNSIEIIPSKNETQKIRITKEAYDNCINNKSVLFRQDKLPALAQEAFVHAKVWLTPKSLAIGSWNMTGAGMNYSRKTNNNIEAGIIYNLSPREYASILDDYPTSILKAPEHYNEDELEKEKEDILDAYTISVDLVANWEKLTIELQNPTYSKLLKVISETDYVKLPGLGKRKIKELECNISFREYSKVLLTDRFFEVENVDGKILFRGYLREVGLASRPVNSFSNIDDYLKGWVLERPEDKLESHRPAYKIEDEFGDEFSDQTKMILLSSDQNAWFTSFFAFECIVNRINETREYYEKDRIKELKRIGRILPGSLSELRSHLDLLIDAYKSDRSNFLKSPIYLWFLIEKANIVFKYFNREIAISEEEIKVIPNVKFEELLSEKQIEEVGQGNLLIWEKYITNKLKINPYVRNS